MAQGCPVLVTPEVGAAEIVRESGAGRVVDGDPVVFGEALRELLDNPERSAIGARGRHFVAARFGWASIARQMEMAYRTCAVQVFPKG
jgi:glycosyltransferase involved in cell wall biosynthesis